MAQQSMRRKYPDPSVYLGDIFYVKIGKQPDVTSFTIHKGLATFYSGYFEAALKQHTFKEGNEGVVTLEETDPVTFGCLVGWLYTHQFRDEASPGCFMPAIKLSLLADRFLMPHLHNRMVDHIRDKVLKDGCNLSPVVLSIYTNTPKKSKLRKFIMVLVALSEFEKYGEQANFPPCWPKEAICDYAIALYTYRTLLSSGPDLKKRVTSLNLCEFHVHEEDERCPKKK